MDKDEQFFYKVTLKGHDGRVWKPRYIFVNECDAITEAKHYDKWFGCTTTPDVIRQWEATIEKYDAMPSGILMFDSLPNVYSSQDCCAMQNCCPLPPQAMIATKTMDEIWHKVPVKSRVKDYLDKLAGQELKA